MERKYIISPEGNYYKAQMHAHSTVSDGKCTPKEVKEKYLAHGYSIVAFTDHSRLVLHNDLTDDKFLAINAYEFEVNHGMIGGGEGCYHLNFYAKTPEVEKQVMFDPHMASWCYSEEELKEFKYVGEPVSSEYSLDFINKAIKLGNENGFMVCYNHPLWSHHLEKDFVPLDGLFAFEIYNHSAQIAENIGFAPSMYTSLIREGKFLGVIASDDSHCGRSKDPESPRYDMGGGYIMVRADKLEYETVIKALENHDFYASTGVEIKELYIEGDKVHVKTSPCKQITLMTDKRRNNCERSLNNDLTEATLNLHKDVEGFWVYCEDEKGKFAASCAVKVK